MTGTVKTVRRPLTDGQRRALVAKARDLRQRSQRRGRVYAIAPMGIAVLWLLTILASDQSWQTVTVFWVVVGAGISVWVAHDFRRDMRYLRSQAEMIESACRRNEADVVDVQSTEYISFEEYEDEGACYAFALEEGGVLVLLGQQYYPSSRFPSLDFSIVTPLDEKDRPVDEFIEKRGARAEPSRVIPAQTKLNLEFPDELFVLDVRLDEVVERLRRR